jgi:4-amino-4-deoxy-L-arabinose transferase-like glycosyltransferase
LTTKSKLAFILFVLTVQGFYWGLGAKPIDKIQEIRLAETAREMADGGNWLIPRYNDALRLQKPPLTYWLTALSYKVFGTVDEFSARFTSATFAALTVFMLFWWVSKTLGATGAAAAGLCLASSYLTLRYFRSGEADAVFLFFITAAGILVYQILFAAPTLGRVLALHLCMGLGFLTKGPAAIAIPLITLLVCSISSRQLSIMRKSLHPAGLLILLLTGFGWYGYIYYIMPEQAGLFVSEQVNDTFITGNHVKPVYWYIYHIFDFFLPWSFFIIPAGIWLYKQRPHPVVVNYAVTWFFITFILLTLNVNKQTQYALLLAPPLMILLGYYLTASTGRFATFNRAALIGLIGIAGIAVIVIFIRSEDGALSSAGQAILLLAGALLPFAIAKLLHYGEAGHYRMILLAGLVAAGFAYGQTRMYLAPAGKMELKEFSLAAKEYTPLFSYPRPNPRVSFYMGQVITVIDENKEGIPTLLDKLGALYIITENSHGDFNQGISSEKIMESEDFGLWKVTK